MKTRLEFAQNSAAKALRNFHIAAQILTAATQIYNLSLADLGSRRGPRRLTWPRQLCIYTIRLYTGMPDATIAALLNCYSSNVTYSVKAVEDALATTPSTLAEVAALVSVIDD